VTANRVMRMLGSLDALEHFVSSSMFVPGYYPDIVELVRSANWLLHNFHSENVDIYNAVNYQHNRQNEGIKYEVIIDMNCLQYLLNIVKRTESSELSRIAAAYLTFFQISDIKLDPTYAIYEKVNYTDDRAEEAISNLEQFYGIDSHALDELAAYALGYEEQLHIQPIISDDPEKLQNSLLQYRRLTDWDSLYLCVLSITDIAMSASISRPKKLLSFINWCISEFRLSIAALIFASALFGQFPAKKMMKYKAKKSCVERQAALRNMTWDLYYVDRYMKSWVSKDEQTESLLLTADAGLKLTMELAVQCQLSGDFEPLRPHLAHELEAIDTAYSTRYSKKRAYKSEEWSHEYRERLIRKYEEKLLK
jgi:hypothetical protein